MQELVKARKYKNTEDLVPDLWQHDRHEQIGDIKALTQDTKGLIYVAQLVTPIPRARYALDLAVRVHSARGDVDIPRELCAEVGRLLVSLARPEPVSAVSGDASTLHNSAPVGMTAQERANWERNMRGLEYAMKQDARRNRR